ncbi:MAG: sel1 repeat family protein [Gammaproteobacteria bacterium]|nr:sel1 repeat family protein [Gammaproteobacteria bacterium]
MKRTTHHKWTTRIGTALTLGLLLVSSAMAQQQTRVLQWQTLPEAPRHGKYVGEPGIPVEVMTDGFLGAHPDIRWRREALHHFSNQRHDEAMKYFLRAARYGDKPAQAMIAEMYQQGLGVPPDPVQAYIWMDLAAERQYPNFLILRETYWDALDSSQQRAVVERGQAVYAEYGDDVAEPRLARVLNRERRQMTGSKVRAAGSLAIIPMTGPMASNAEFTSTSWAHGGAMSIRGEVFYGDQYWDPAEYRAFQDIIWQSAGRPEVAIGRLQSGDNGRDD